MDEGHWALPRADWWMRDSTGAERRVSGSVALGPAHWEQDFRKVGSVAGGAERGWGSGYP